MRQNRNNKTRIEIIKRLTSQAYFYRDAILFCIKDGSGRLFCRNVSENDRRSETNNIYLDDSILFRMLYRRKNRKKCWGFWNRPSLGKSEL